LVARLRVHVARTFRAGPQPTRDSAASAAFGTGATTSHRFCGPVAEPERYASNNKVQRVRKVFNSFLTRLAGASALALLGLPAAAFSQPLPHSSYEDAAWGASFAGAPRYRGDERIWTARGQISPAADTLLAILKRADLDGMSSHKMAVREVERALADAQYGGEAELDAAEAVLSDAWVHYVQTLRRPADIGMIFVDPSLAPAAPSANAILAEAAAAPSLSRHLEQVSRVNPVYAQLREGLATLLASGNENDALVRDLRLNLERARVLPSRGRYLFVDAAAQRLFMVEDGQIRDSMKVIVGKPEEPTPMIASRIQHAVVNPYWNVPPDLVRKSVAPKAVKGGGAAYIRSRNYELLSDWSDNPEVVDPDTIDWAAVAAGEKELRIRQLPGPANAMGQIKFMFPNKLGVYLHDTPEKELFAKAQRTFSSGCIRLEDPKRLARWLFGRMPEAGSDRPEQIVPLDRPVPVYVTYLTASWDGNEVARRPDIYGRDRASASHMVASD
jgi:L,D-transpeptidase YcbB